MNNLILYGGTFDPIHNGHLNIAKNVQDYFSFEQFHFMPCKIPALKQNSHASAEHRVNMLQLALKQQPLSYNFHLDCTEVNRATPSYTEITLSYYRQMLGDDTPLTLLIGYENLCTLPTWYQWERIIELANLLVVHRAGYQEKKPPKAIKTMLDNHLNSESREILGQSCGVIHLFDAGQFEISSTLLRQKLANNEDVSVYLPAKILDYIKSNQLYGNS